MQFDPMNQAGRLRLGGWLDAPGVSARTREPPWPGDGGPRRTQLENSVYQHIRKDADTQSPGINRDHLLVIYSYLAFFFPRAM